MTRCQICGRRKHLRKDGTVVHHFTGGTRCEGAGFPPIEVDDGRLAEVVATLTAREREARAAIRELEERRANYIDPALRQRETALFLRRFKLERRLDRIRDWPRRYARARERQLYEHGYCWAEEPPAYLVARVTAQP